MFAKYKVKAYLCVVMGYLLEIICYVSSLTSDFNGLLFLSGFVLFLIGCCFYAKAKGSHGAWGLLGLLGVIGLVVLGCFQDKREVYTNSGGVFWFCMKRLVVGIGVVWCLSFVLGCIVGCGTRGKLENLNLFEKVAVYFGAGEGQINKCRNGFGYPYGFSCSYQFGFDLAFEK